LAPPTPPSAGESNVERPGAMSRMKVFNTVQILGE